MNIDSINELIKIIADIGFDDSYDATPFTSMILESHNDENFLDRLNFLTTGGCWSNYNSNVGMHSPLSVTEDDGLTEESCGYFNVFIVSHEKNISFRPFQKMIHETAKYYLQQPDADEGACRKALLAFDKEIDRLERNHERWKKTKSIV